jgi:hypothetical protein
MSSSSSSEDSDEKKAVVSADGTFYDDEVSFNERKRKANLSIYGSFREIFSISSPPL